MVLKTTFLNFMAVAINSPFPQQILNKSWLVTELIYPEMETLGNI